MLTYTTEGTTIVKQQEKVTNKTLQQMNIIGHLQQAFFIFTLDKPSWAKPTFTRYMF